MFCSAFAADLGGYKPTATGMLVGIVNLREAVVIKDLISELITEHSLATWVREVEERSNSMKLAVKNPSILNQRAVRSLVHTGK